MSNLHFNSLKYLYKSVMNNKIDAILPTIYNDFYHTKFLLKSLDKNMLCLKTLHIIVPDLEFEKISSSIKDLNLKINYELIKESFLVPKIQKYKNIKGWYKQQVIKLSAHNIITTDFFLVLDSDVILKQELKYEDLIKDNKSSYFYFDSNLIFEFNRFLIILVSFLNKSIFKNLDFLMGGAGGFITWISGSRRILNINKKGVRYYNFTPCVLSKNALNLTINHINSNVEGYNNYYKIKFKIYKFFFNIKDYNWQDYLLINTPIFNFPKKFAHMDDAFATWAEYSVYYNFLEHKKIIDNYHFFQDHTIYDLENSVWWWFSANKKINNLKIKKNNQPFIVIQSRSNVDSSLKEDFIKKFIL